MKRLPNATQRVLMALVIGVVAVPVSTPAVFINHTAIGESRDISSVQDMEDRRSARAKQRSSWRIAEQVKRAEDVAQDTLHAAASEEGSPVTSLSTDALTSEDRAMLRRYTRAHTCPLSLKNSPIPGFYRLCLSVVGEDASSDAIQGFINHDAYLHQASHTSTTDVSAFKLRMQMLEQATDSTRRRDGGSVPGRPTTCSSNPNCLQQQYGG